MEFRGHQFQLLVKKKAGLSQTRLVNYAFFLANLPFFFISG
jgi:hypothetical protein